MLQNLIIMYASAHSQHHWISSSLIEQDSEPPLSGFRLPLLNLGYLETVGQWTKGPLWNIAKIANFALVKSYNDWPFHISTTSAHLLTSVMGGINYFLLWTELNMHLSAHSQHHWITSGLQSPSPSLIEQDGDLPLNGFLLKRNFSTPLTKKTAFLLINFLVGNQEQNCCPACVLMSQTDSSSTSSSSSPLMYM